MGLDETSQDTTEMPKSPWRHGMCWALGQALAGASWA